MDAGRLFTTWDSLLLVFVATVAIYLTVVIYTRMAGPRTLASMSSFDFAATVAVGSTVAAAASMATPLAHGVVTLGVLYAAQAGAALLRRQRTIERVIDNSPLLLMAGSEVLTENLRQARMSEPELWSQLRQAGVVRRDRILAVVMETTGSISVLQGESPDELDPVLLSGVRDAERLRG